MILENFAHTLQEVIDDTAIETVIVTGVGDLLGFPKSRVGQLRRCATSAGRCRSGASRAPCVSATR